MLGATQDPRTDSRRLPRHGTQNCVTGAPERSWEDGASPPILPNPAWSIRTAGLPESHARPGLGAASAGLSFPCTVTEARLSDLRQDQGWGRRRSWSRVALWGSGWTTPTKSMSCTTAPLSRGGIGGQRSSLESGEKGGLGDQGGVGHPIVSGSAWGLQGRIGGWAGRSLLSTL